MRRLFRTTAFLVLLVLTPLWARAQSDAPVGVRAAGMGGAFVAVADDASAVFWNPAGLAAGAYFSAVVDRNTLETGDDAEFPRGRSGWLVAVATPPLGVSYYRTRVTRVTSLPSTGSLADVRLDSLVAHHVGVTLVHSIVSGLAVGGTLKLVHGIAAAEETTRPVDIDVAGDLPGRGSNEFDADIGAMLTTRAISVGVSVRNLFEPSFAVDDGPPILLERRVRAGVSVPMTLTLRVSADVDFTKVSSSGGPWRDAAVGGEGRVTPRAAVRAGVHWNTAGETVGGAAPIGSVGGSYRVFGTILADGQVSFGSRNGDHGWGVGARIVF